MSLDEHARQLSAALIGLRRSGKPMLCSSFFMRLMNADIGGMGVKSLRGKRTKTEPQPHFTQPQNPL